MKQSEKFVDVKLEAVGSEMHPNELVIKHLTINHVLHHTIPVIVQKIVLLSVIFLSIFVNPM